MSSNTFGGTIKLGGESEYRKALSQIGAELKVMGSEMSKITAEYGKNNTSVDALTKSNSNLESRIEKQKEKIEVLKGALENASAEYGETDKKTLNWQNSLNKAEAELILLQNEVEKNNKTLQENADSLKENSNEIKKIGNESEQSGRKAFSLGDIIKANLISDAIKKGLSEVVDSIKAMGNACVDIGKQALDGYANYEQLIGGVETLFGNSAPVVEEYANKAYQTAGMSANEYMETVTSFSASLLQSLNNDTEKTAEVSDMAVRDMSDNANKMGTSMESIQNAYQGFAKQNYTMLDNLKLGYGGTKEEMERLLADASAISGVDYDISNLNDVYQAIHTIQGEIGITGSTTAEATKTISGSISAMQSAWSNLISGLANGNADMKTLVGNLVDSAITSLDNILPAIDGIVNGAIEALPLIITKITENLPRFMQLGVGILNSLITGIQSNLPLIISSVFEILTTLTTTLLENLPVILEMGIQIIISLVQGIAESLPTLIPQIVDAVILMTETLIDNIDLLINAGIQLIMGLSQGLINALPILIDKIPVLIDKLIQALTSNLPKLMEMGVTLNVQLGLGLIKAIPQLISKIPQIIGSIVSGFGNYMDSMKEVGLNLIKGLWNGISDSWEWLKEKIFSFANGITDSIKSFFGIHSPSKLFEDEIGVNLALGVGEGFEQQMQDVKDTMQNALPTGSTFETEANYSFSGAQSIMSIDSLEEAFSRALKKSKQYILVDKDVLGRLVTDIVDERFGFEV